MLSHLLELRRRAILTLLIFTGFFCFFFLYRNTLFSVLVGPLLNALPNHQSLITTEISASVFLPLSLAANTALLSTAPMALFHFWRFIMPGLYPNELKALQGMFIASLGFFAVGLLFCFYIVLPFMFQFFVSNVPSGVTMMPDIGHCYDFITRMLLLFGLIFQLPLVCLGLVRLQCLDLASLQKARPYVIVGAFVIGMLLTPPDVLSQVLLALPLCVLYELGILLAKWRLGRFHHQNQQSHKNN